MVSSEMQTFPISKSVVFVPLTRSILLSTWTHDIPVLSVSQMLDVTEED
jgi:hypothetical protein